VNSPSKFTLGRTSSTDMHLAPTLRKSEAATETKRGGSELRALRLEGTDEWCAEMVNGVLMARAGLTIMAREPIRWLILRP
jgi:hypothetical protein